MTNDRPQVRPYRRGGRLRALAGGGLMVCLLAGLVGCIASDPRFENRQAARNARIHRVLADWALREHRNGTNLAHTVTLGEDLGGYHEQHLDKTLRHVDQAARRERALWPSRLQETGDVLQKEFAGDLTNIDATIPYLFY